MRDLKFPILTTHVANIALNKTIALPFLLSEAQETHGLTEYSNESYINDKLLVATWMIQSFMALNNEEAEPWVTLPEWEVPGTFMEGIKTIEEFDEIIEKIKAESKNFNNIWDDENLEAVSFLNKVIAQAYECMWYTNQRLTAIEVLVKMGPGGQDDPRAIMSAGMEMAEKLSANPMMMMVGYLAVKNEMNSKRVLASNLLQIILEFLVDKAAQEGYAKPVEEPA